MGWESRECYRSSSMRPINARGSMSMSLSCTTRLLPSIWFLGIFSPIFLSRCSLHRSGVPKVRWCKVARMHFLPTGKVSSGHLGSVPRYLGSNLCLRMSICLGCMKIPVRRTLLCSRTAGAVSDWPGTLKTDGELNSQGQALLSLSPGQE